MPEERLLTVREAARRCQRSEETVRRWIWSGKLPAKKLGNQLFVEESELSRFQAGLQISEPKVKYRPLSGRRRGEMRLSKGEALRDIEEDKRFQNEVLAQYGPVDVVALIAEPAPRLTERQYRRLEARETKLRQSLLERHGYFDVAELVRRSREGH